MMGYAYIGVFGWVCGAACCNVLPQLWPLAAILGAGVALAYGFWKLQQVPWAVWVLGVMVGLAGGTFRAQQILAFTWDPAYFGRLVWLEGQIQPVQRTLRAVTLDMMVHAVDHQPIAPVRFRMYSTPQVAKLLPAQAEVGFYARVRPPIGRFDPDLPDLERAWFLAGVRALGVPVIDAQHPCSVAPIPLHGVAAYRKYLSDLLDRTVRAPAPRGILKAVLLGQRDEIPAATWQLWQRTGVSHLLAISGLHVGGVFAGALVLARLCTRWSTSSALYGWRVGIGLVCAGAYSLLAVSSVSVMRAAWMVGVFGIARLGAKAVGFPAVFAVALCAVLVWDPLAPMRVGFWLSFGAVWFLYWIPKHPAIRRLHPWLRPWAVQGLFTLAMAPMGFGFFQNLSLWGIGVNALVIPWVSCAVVFPVLGAAACAGIAPMLAEGLIAWAAQALIGITPVLQYVADQPSAVWTWVRPDWIWIAAGIGAAVAVLPRFPGQGWTAWTLLPVLCYSPARPPMGGVWVALLDVGQGLAALVQTRHHALMFDFGPVFGGSRDASEVIVPVCRARGIRILDVGVVSHGDLDHRAGLDGVRAAIPIRTLYSGEPARVPRHTATPCMRGQRWQWDGVTFQFLHPDRDFRSRKSNDASCVLEIRVGTERILLPGDIEKGGGRAVLAALGADPKTTVLIAPHHGSAHAPLGAFITELAPQYTLVSVGCQNRYGLPKKAVLAEYAQHGRVGSTALEGRISVAIARGGVRVWGARAVDPRFWQDPARACHCAHPDYMLEP